MPAMRDRQIVDVLFAREKYGSELLVDVAPTTALEGFITDETPHRLAFYDLSIVTRGRGHVWLDSVKLDVAPGTVLFTSPGQVRRWQVERLEGLCLFFEDGFISEFFSDALFLERLIFFHTPRDPVVLELAADEHGWLASRLSAMREELHPVRADSTHLLRAALYEVLVTLNRWCLERAGLEALQPNRGTAAVFRRTVEAEYRDLHEVQGYARLLAVTPGHLNHLAKRHLGATAGSVIRGRIVLEAKRLLLHSEARVARIATELGFPDASYFSRFFRRETGTSPSAYREQIREKYHC